MNDGIAPSPAFASLDLVEAISCRASMQESKDCTVLASALCLRIPYQEAHARLAMLGREKGKGIRFPRVAPKLGLRQMAFGVGMKVRTILDHLTPGDFVVVGKHVFAVRDGILLDRFPGKQINRMVKAVYQPLTASKVHFAGQTTTTTATTSIEDTNMIDINEIEDIRQLVNLTGAELVEVFNALTGDTVKKFSSRENGLKRCAQALRARAELAKSKAPAAKPVEPSPVAAPAPVTPSPAAAPAKTPKVAGEYNRTPRGFTRPVRPGSRREKLLNMLLEGATREQLAELGYGETLDSQIRYVYTWLGYGIRTTNGTIQAYTA